MTLLWYTYYYTIYIYMVTESICAVKFFQLTATGKTSLHRRRLRRQCVFGNARVCTSVVTKWPPPPLGSIYFSAHTHTHTRARIYLLHCSHTYRHKRTRKSYTMLLLFSLYTPRATVVGAMGWQICIVRAAVAISVRLGRSNDDEDNIIYHVMNTIAV